MQHPNHNMISHPLMITFHWHVTFLPLNQYVLIIVQPVPGKPNIENTFYIPSHTDRWDRNIANLLIKSVVKLRKHFVYMVMDHNCWISDIVTRIDNHMSKWYQVHTYWKDRSTSCDGTATGDRATTINHAYACGQKLCKLSSTETHIYCTCWSYYYSSCVTVFIVNPGMYHDIYHCSNIYSNTSYGGGGGI